MAKATGATIVTTLADMEGDETFDAEVLGSAEEVAEETVADNDMVMIRGPKNTRAVTGAVRCGAARWGGGSGWGLGGRRHCCRCRWGKESRDWSHFLAVSSSLLLLLLLLLTLRPALPPFLPALTAAPLQCFCGAPTTTCWTRWIARCTTPSASSSACSRAGRSCRVRAGARVCCVGRGAQGAGAARVVFPVSPYFPTLRAHPFRLQAAARWRPP